MTAEITIAKAWPQPRPDEEISAEMSGFSQSAQPWTTGNARIVDLIHQNGERYGVDPYFIYCDIIRSQV